MFNICVDDLERIHGLLFPGIMDYYFLVLWTIISWYYGLNELCYHIWPNQAISVSCNSVLLHTRLSIYNNIYIY